MLVNNEDGKRTQSYTEGFVKWNRLPASTDRSEVDSFRGGLDYVDDHDYVVPSARLADMRGLRICADLKTR